MTVSREKKKTKILIQTIPTQHTDMIFKEVEILGRVDVGVEADEAKTGTQTSRVVTWGSWGRWGWMG
jgi:hypothetical protein